MANKKEVVQKAYICGVDWQEEIRHANDVKLYSDLEVFKRERKCWKECGIVELNITVNKWVHPQDLFGKNTKK